MASEVDICNLALAHLGDKATVSSIDPPEGSAQAEHCARFYPIARNALLEMRNTDWAFATRRVTLSLLAHTLPGWAYSYAIPADLVRVVGVLDPDDADEHARQDYIRELSPDGTSQIIYTNQAAAKLKYVALVADTTRFSPLFTLSLSWLVASMVAGPLLKGEAGRAEAKRCLGVAQGFWARAAESDANQQRVRQEYKAPWLGAR